MINTAEKSTIVLLCLGLDTDKSEVKKMDIAKLKQIFRKYGRLKKVIIFTRKILLKAFLEFFDFESASAAKNAVHEQIVGNYGKARLYFSPLQDLKACNKFVECWEYSDEKQQSTDEESLTRCSLRCSTLEDKTGEFNNKECYQGYMNSFVVPQNRYSLFSMNTEPSASLFRKKSFLSDQKFIFNQNNLQSNSNLIDLIEMPTIFDQNPINNANDDIVCLSRVVLVSNLAFVFKNTNELFNLFSSFGNITKILYMKNLQKALIEYSNVRYASEAITNLNNLAIADTKLRVNFSKYHTIDLNKNNKNENSMQYNDVLIVPPMKNRYKANSEVMVKPLSSTLLVSFPNNKSIQTIDVYLAIEKYCKPIKTKLVKSKSYIGMNEVVHLMFSFEDIQSAVYVVYKCNESIVKGTLIDICFF